ncbi:MAG: restriction endonuclease subunit S [Bacteroidales bacterium]|nr:restriction endonuclease subunit S [Candidatus Colimorpha pelethequi]
MEWPKLTLDQLGSVSRGRSKHRPRNDESLFGGDYPFIQTGDVKKAGLHLTDFEETYNEQGLAQSKLWNPETLCITIAANIADTSILGIKACFPDSIMGFIANPNKADVRFVKYSFDILQKRCQAMALGATQDNLSWEKLAKIKFSIPPLPIQQKIASILSTYDTLIENNTKRIRLLEQMAENLYKEWFVRFRFPGHENVEMENGLPKGWKVERLGDWGICLETGSRPKGGVDDSLAEGMPSFGAEVIKNLAEFDYHSVKLIPIEFYRKLKRGKNTGNDILLYKDGAYIGKVTLFRDDFPFKEYSINEHVFFISPNNVSYKNYIYFTLHQKEYFLLMQNLNRNAAQPGLSQQDIFRIKMTIPDEDIIKEFNSEIEPLLISIFSYAKQNTLLTRQRDLLLPRLMSGKLEVMVR